MVVDPRDGLDPEEWAWVVRTSQSVMCWVVGAFCFGVLVMAGLVLVALWAR